MARTNITSEFKGVHFCKAKQRFIARITENKKTRHLGCFLFEIDAHRAYQKELLKQ